MAGDLGAGGRSMQATRARGIGGAGRPKGPLGTGSAAESPAAAAGGGAGDMGAALARGGCSALLTAGAAGVLVLREATGTLTALSRRALGGPSSEYTPNRGSVSGQSVAAPSDSGRYRGPGTDADGSAPKRTSRTSLR